MDPKKMRSVEVFFLYATYFLAICVPLGMWKMAEILLLLIRFLYQVR